MTYLSPSRFQRPASITTTGYGGRIGLSNRRLREVRRGDGRGRFGEGTRGLPRISCLLRAGVRSEAVAGAQRAIPVGPAGALRGTAQCGKPGCLLRSQCFAAKGMTGRRVLVHPQETLLQEARALQQSADYGQSRQRRVVAEYRLARLEQLGIRQARYFGRFKTKFQLYLAATVVNLTLLANQTGVVDNPGVDPDSIVATAPIGSDHGVDHHLLPTWILAWLRSPTLALSLCPTRAFRPAFQTCRLDR